MCALFCPSFCDINFMKRMWIQLCKWMLSETACDVECARFASLFTTIMSLNMFVCMCEAGLASNIVKMDEFIITLSKIYGFGKNYILKIVCARQNKTDLGSLLVHITKSNKKKQQCICQFAICVIRTHLHTHITHICTAPAMEVKLSF